jgi:prepilin-type N-terminal cleavage/methylation domain-containing protein
MTRARRHGAAPRPAGFTLVEMLATVAALVIVLGLAVSLARYVRLQASDRLTKDLLSQLDELVRRYEERYKALPAVPAFVEGGGGTEAAKGGRGAGGTEGGGSRAGTVGPLPLPAVSATLPFDALPPETDLQHNADLNNRAFVAALRVEARRHPADFAALPPSFESDGTLHDAWGTPLVFMPSMHPAVGMAIADDPFFLSAGPDRQFRTLEDNLFSYEEAEGGP